MVENVDRIDAQLKPLGLRDLEPLAHGTVQAPCSWQFESIPAEAASRPGLWILQDDLASGVNQRIERANRLESGGDTRTLRVDNPYILAAKIVAGRSAILPLH